MPRCCSSRRSTPNRSSRRRATPKPHGRWRTRRVRWTMSAPRIRAVPSQRAHARSVLIPGLLTTLDQLRAALQAAPVTLATLPASLVRDWVTPDGRARIEVFPKGEVGANAALRRFVAAVETLAPGATGAPVSIEASSRTIIGAFVQAGIWALVSITALLTVALRRASDVALTLAPLVLSALGTLATKERAGPA